MDVLILKPGREKSLKRRHPWVFSGAVAKVQGNPGAGDTVGIRSATGELLAIAAYSPKSQIVARVWDWREIPIDREFFHKRIAQAVAQRKVLLDQPDTGAMRLVHGESDGLPGVVADRYGDTVVLQLTSAGAERWREVIADALLEVSGASRIWERSDVEVRLLEGLAPVIAALRGAPEPTRIGRRAVAGEAHDEATLADRPPAKSGALVPSPEPGVRRVVVEARTTRRRSAPEQTRVEPPAAEATPVINVTIGRVEVRAVPAAPPTQRSEGRGQRPMSLEEYLKRRGGGR